MSASVALNLSGSMRALNNFAVLTIHRIQESQSQPNNTVRTVTGKPIRK